MIAVIDYGAGNIFSVKNALDFLGCENVLTKSEEKIKNADGIILPGVGAFPHAMKMLWESGLVDTIKDEAKKKPFLGICLGMQLLFEKSFEFEECAGLGLIGGYVDKIPDEGLIIPHMGWNRLEVQHECPLFEGLSDNGYVYFVHSYRLVTKAPVVSATCFYGEDIQVAAQKDNIFAVQFHPEKSGDTGLKILYNFGRL